MVDDPPIEELNYQLGRDVIQIEDLRISRGMTRRPRSSCPHHQLVYDPQERRIWCKDCEQEIHPYDAFLNIAERSAAHSASLNRRGREIKEAEQFTLRMRASKVMDQAWRKMSTVPCCPHCKNGILPEDVVHGLPSMSKILAQRINNPQGKK